MPKGTIATLTVDLIGNSALLQADLRRANFSVQKFVRSARKEVNRFGAAFVGATTTAGAALAAMTVSFNSSIDNLAKTADKIGVHHHRPAILTLSGGRDRRRR